MSAGPYATLSFYEVRLSSPWSPPAHNITTRANSHHSTSPPACNYLLVGPISGKGPVYNSFPTAHRLARHPVLLFSHLDQSVKFGRACSACPAAKCTKKGLCRCNNPFCGPNGETNVETCKCQCKSPFSGRACDKKICPRKDPDYCGVPQPRGYTKQHCKVFSNVPEECPHMCGTC